MDYIARQTLLFMGFSRQEYWSGILEWLPFPPEDLPNPGIKPEFPALQAISLLTEPPGKPSKPNKLLLKNAVILWSPLMLLFSPSEIPLWLLGLFVIQGSKVGWKQKVLQGYQPGTHEYICFSSLLSKTSGSFFPASLRKSRTLQDTVRESPKHMAGRSGLQSVTCPPFPPTPGQNLMRAGTLCALRTALGWHVVISKHFLNEHDRVAKRPWGTWSLLLESFSQE